MHIETLKTFCDLVDTGSFSKAARENYVSQSAVSQQLRALETHYDRRLIERGPGRPLLLTDAGRVLYSEGKAILERFRALEHRLREDAHVMTGTLRVATVYSVGLHALPPVVKLFLAAHPHVNVRVEYSRTDRVYAACLDGTIDLGIVAQPHRRAQIDIVPLRPEPLVLVCSPDHKLARRRKIAINQLEGAPFVAFDRNVPTRKTVDRLLKEHGVVVSIVTEFDNIETIKRSVEAGLGLSIVPHNCVRNESKARTLVPIKIEGGPYTRTIGVIHRKGVELGPTATAFLRLVTDVMG